MKNILLEETERERNYFEQMWKEITNMVEKESSGSEDSTGLNVLRKNFNPMITYLWPIVPWTPQNDSKTKKRKKSGEGEKFEEMSKKIKLILNLCEKNLSVDILDGEDNCIIIID